MTLSPNLMHDALHERNQYTIEREAQLGRWRADLASLEMQTSGGNLAHQDKLINLKREMDEVEDQLETLKDASGETWEDLKSNVDQAWEELSALLEKVKKEWQ
jgi:hypothetical protein